MLNNTSGKTHWTIHDIARETGVSAKTVSRVLNHKSGVGPEVRARILRLMEEVGYQPHIGARSLRSHQNACIGVTVPAPADEVPVSQSFLVWLFTYLYDTFGSRGEFLAFDLNPFATAEGYDYGRGIWQQLFKACVIAGPMRADDQVIARIHASGVPYLALGRLDSLPECSSATVDYEEGARLSAEFLIGRGHRRIAMLGGFAGFQPGVERMRGHRRALENAGIPYDPELVRFVGFDPEGFAGEAQKLLADPTVTALVDASGTENGPGLREGARRAGRVIGHDLELVAWTYVNNAVVVHEAAAHLWLPVRESAAQGIEQLAQWMEGSRPGPVKVLHAPMIDTRSKEAEVPRPRRLFDPRG